MNKISSELDTDRSTSVIKLITKHRLFIPIAFLAFLLLINIFINPGFLKISLGSDSTGNPVLIGNLINILSNSTELVILAIGMTLVTASSRGQDISVGATIAIVGGVIMRVLCGNETQPTELHAPIIVALLLGCLAGMACGAFNGILVAKFNIQPMVATLILFTAGRSIGSMAMGGLKPKAVASFGYYGNFIPGVPIPTPILITVVIIAITFLMLKKTNLGLYTQAVGINDKSSRLNGLNPAKIKFLTYVILGLCVGIAGFIQSSRVQTVNPYTIVPSIEMDVILAVALGGNSLGGGKFNMTGSIIGAYTIQTLTSMLTTLNVNTNAVPVFKAVIIIILVAIQTPVIREFFGKRVALSRLTDSNVKESG
ncbi:ABC transporter permease [Ruminiclostridium herbifermentans]|uniref:ABC transporter permease n=1 Tax=Ruminiclostridium herbifermentans TaxID=2488810 RepID=A0A4U7JIA4_9FIRM|nr:ABC transporter permease [Ruminiclostridium herbifermentans]QNU67030.1 ABC transporter permease [Ruminiclostridium herbifermentans]